MNSRGSGNVQRDLNHMAPAANVARLGDVVNDLITQLNFVIAQHNELVVQLVAAAGLSVPVLTATTALTAPGAVTTLATTRTAEIAGDLP